MWKSEKGLGTNFFEVSDTLIAHGDYKEKFVDFLKAIAKVIKVTIKFEATWEKNGKYFILKVQ